MLRGPLLVMLGPLALAPALVLGLGLVPELALEVVMVAAVLVALEPGLEQGQAAVQQEVVEQQQASCTHDVLGAS